MTGVGGVSEWGLSTTLVQNVIRFSGGSCFQVLMGWGFQVLTGVEGFNVLSHIKANNVSFL